MKHFDYIIVGQGIAGTLLDYFLGQQGFTVGVIDDVYERSASRVAAGLINPITGRRYVKSWRIEKLLPVARNTYRLLEDELGISVFQELNIIRSLFNHREENDWLARSGEPGYEKYLLDEVNLGAYEKFTEPVFSYGEVKCSAQVNLAELIQHYREKLRSENRLLESTFDYPKLEIQEAGVRYGDWQADAIIFCEGAKAQDNPFFHYLPFKVAKGEVLLIKIPDATFDKIFKHRVFIIPLGDELYWVGSTYDWKYEDDQPTQKGRTFLEERLRDILKTPYEIVTHSAAIRPTVKDRRPFLGRHPLHQNLMIFNGLGTKGTSLAPFWAQHFAQHLATGEPLNPAVDIRRFEII